MKRLRNRIHTVLTAATLAAIVLSALLFPLGSNALAKDVPGNPLPEPIPETINIDYALGNFLSLALRYNRLLENEFRNDDVKFNWILSQGGNKSMEFLLSGSVDFAFGAGIAGIVSYINGNPIRAIYLLNTQQGNLFVRKDRGIDKLSDLKGKTIAVTPNTNPYIFVLRAMENAGLGKKDVTIVPLQHHDGMAALLRGDVDAWSGGERLNAAVRADGSAKSIFKNPEFFTPVFLYVRNEFYKQYPHTVLRVISSYEKARDWAKQHPDEFLNLVARENKLTAAETNILIDDYNIETGRITDAHMNSMYGIGNSLKLYGIIDRDLDFNKKVDELVDRSLYGKL